VRGGGHPEPAGPSSRPGTQREGERDGGEKAPVSRIVYLSGIGRSGSTLLSRTLDGVEGFFAVGELFRVFGRGLLDRELCSCGEPVPECPVWGEVAGRLRARGLLDDLARLERFRRRTTEGLWLPTLFTPFRSLQGPDFRSRLDRFREVLRALYAELDEVTGGAILVDASKNAGYGKILTETPGLEVFLVHLVRDSRGVTWSLQKKKPRPGTRGEADYFERRGPLLGSVLWSFAQLMTERLEEEASGFTRVRYQDFIHDPASTVRRIAELAGAGDRVRELSHVEGGAVELGGEHLIASNPNRKQRGTIELREDLEWRGEMGLLQRGLVTALTYPLLSRYDLLAPNGPAPGSRRPHGATPSDGAAPADGGSPSR